MLWLAKSAEVYSWTLLWLAKTAEMYGEGHAVIG